MKLSEKTIEAIKSDRKIDAIKLIRSEKGVSLAEAKIIVESFNYDTNEAIYESPVGNTKQSVTGIEKFIFVLFFLSFPYIFFSDASSWSLIMFATTLALMGVSVLKVNFDKISEAHSSKAWPTVKVTIKKAQVHKSRGRNNAGLYTPLVRYVYEVEGDIYEGDRISFGTYSGSRNYAENILEEATKISPLKIHYNPDDHGNSVLIPGVKTIQLSGVLIGIGMIVSGIFGNYLIYMESL